MFSAEHSLKSRLIGVSLIWIALGSLAGYWILSSALRTHATTQFYDKIMQHVEELEKLSVIDEGGNVSLSNPFLYPKYAWPNSGYYWEVKSGQSVFLSPSLKGVNINIPEDPFDVAKPLHKHKTQGPTGTLLLVEKVASPDPITGISNRYIVGTDKRHLDNLIKGFNGILAWGMFGFALVMMLAAAGLTSFALRPFKRLSGGFKDVRTGRTENLEGHYPSEVKPLVDELNGLMDVSGSMQSRARAQAGNLAHGLKNSLAIVSDEAFKLADEGHGKSSKSIIDQCGIMQRHIDHHIARARASAAAKLPGTHANVSEVLTPILKALARLYTEKNITVKLDFQSQKAVPVDPLDLSEIFGNILDNAYKFTRSTIDIQITDSDKDTLLIRVNDDGPGLPPEARDLVFEIGERWDERQSGGGLGLAIVRDLVELYNGHCSLDVSPQNGLRIDVILPSVDI